MKFSVHVAVTAVVRRTEELFGRTVQIATLGAFAHERELAGGEG